MAVTLVFVSAQLTQTILFYQEITACKPIINRSVLFNVYCLPRYPVTWVYRRWVTPPLFRGWKLLFQMHYLQCYVSYQLQNLRGFTYFLQKIFGINDIKTQIAWYLCDVIWINVDPQVRKFRRCLLPVSSENYETIPIFMDYCENRGAKLLRNFGTYLLVPFLPASCLWTL